MKRILSLITAIAGVYALNAHADAALTFELAGPTAESQTKTISLARFFARIDDPAEPNSFLLYQAGKFFPLYQVDQEAHTYTLLTPEVNPTLHAGLPPKPESTETESATTDTQKTETAEAPTSDTSDQPSNPDNAEQKPAVAAESSPPQTPPQAAEKASTETSEAAAPEKNPKTTLHLTPKSMDIAGINCRVVEELMDKQPIIKHCMADKARLGITEREIRTLARTFKMARDRDFGWLGTATKDEKFVSIASEDLSSHKKLTLQSISTKPLPSDYLRIPRDYTKTAKE
jgi:hypothetical protein